MTLPSSVTNALLFWDSVSFPAVTWNVSNTSYVPTTVSTTDKAAIISEIDAVYNKSMYFRNLVDDYIKSGNIIRIGTDNTIELGGTAKASADQFTVYDLPDIENFYYINDKGFLISELQGITIVHELIHLMTSYADPSGKSTEMNGVDYDYKGDTVELQNKISMEMEWFDNIQTSYQFTIDAIKDPLIGLIFPFYAFSGGETIDVSRWGDASSNLLDHTNRTGNSRDLFFGLGGDDTLMTADGDDHIFGGEGEDQIYGGGGNDHLYGEADDDTFYVDGGDDLIWGGPREDDFGAADGTDTVDYSSGVTGIRIFFDGSSSVPTLTVKDGTGGTDTLHSIEKILGTSKADRFEFSGDIPNGYNLTIDVGGGSTDGDVFFTFNKSHAATEAIVNSTGGGTLSNASGSGSITLKSFGTLMVGSDYDDSITDLSIHDEVRVIDARGGNDEIEVDGADSLIQGGSGTDAITGGAGSDSIYGGSDDDVVHGGDGSDFISTKAGEWSETNVDEIYGDEGDDYIEVVDGTEASITGGAGNDSIAGAGSATIYFGEGDGHDLVLNDAMYDERHVIDLTTLVKEDVSVIWDIQTVLSESGDGYEVAYGKTGLGTLVIEINETGDSIAIENVYGAVGWWDKSPGIYDSVAFDLDTILFSDGALTGSDMAGATPTVGFSLASASAYVTAPADYAAAVAPTSGANDGTSGDDDMRGSRGNDTINGDDGDDTFHQSGGNDTIDGGSGFDTLRVFGRSDGFDIYEDSGSLILEDKSGLEGKYTLTSVEAIYFATEDDTYALEDFLGYYGTSGNDLIEANDHENEIYADNGDDTIIGKGMGDYIDGGDGDDTAQYAGSSADYILYRSPFDGSIKVEGDPEAEPFDAEDTVVNVEHFYFAGDKVTVDLSSIPALGTSGNDVLSGSARGDVLYGLEGDDTISSGDGNDRIDGGEGEDTMAGGDGDDFYSVDDIADLVVESADEGRDTVWSSISYTLPSNVERVFMWMANTDDVDGTGNALDNEIGGSEGENRLTGGAGNDVLYGESGDDTAVYAGKKADYSIVTDDGFITIVDDEPAIDGDDGTDTIYAMEHAEFQDGTVGLAAPIVLDLDGDGVSLVDRGSSKVRFDWDRDGTAEKTGWIDRGDGFLVLDRNDDDAVSGAEELSFVDDKPDGKARAKSDLDGLSAFDSNHDGKLSAADERFASFGIWRDENRNGKSDVGEFVTLDRAGITSISLAAERINRNWNVDENILINLGSFSRSDGSIGTFGDVALSYSESGARSAQGGHGGLAWLSAEHSSHGATVFAAFG